RRSRPISDSHIQLRLPPALSRQTAHSYYYLILAMSGGKPDEAAAGPSAPSTTAPTQQPVEAIEEDDEFEEFEPCQWNANEEDAEDSQQWQDSWDDDDIDDEFTTHLRAELSKSG
ncbi:hypothetical protein ACHAXH_000612, partial [Discostella pseudostelligera]